MNRGGDRQANRAIHDIVRCRMSKEERTQDYLAKKMAEGKTKKEAIRCVCRFVSREVYKLMTGPQIPLPDPTALRERRLALGLTQMDVGLMLGTSNNRISVLELGKALDGEGLREYEALLETIEVEGLSEADGENVENPDSRL